MANVRTLVLLRHGQYDESSLTPLGRRQAEHAARRIARLPITAIHCSTMTRAIETAEIAAKRLRGLAPRRARLLRECLPSTPPSLLKRGLTIPASVRRAASAQVDGAYRRFFKRATGGAKCDLIVCHGNVIRYLVFRALGQRGEGWWNFGTSHCGITVVRILHDGRIKVDAYNDTGHLPRGMVTS